MPGRLRNDATCPQCDTPLMAIVDTRTATCLVRDYFHQKGSPDTRRRRRCSKTFYDLKAAVIERLYLEYQEAGTVPVVVAFKVMPIPRKSDGGLCQDRRAIHRHPSHEEPKGRDQLNDVTHLAVFEQPGPILNPLGVTVRAPVTLEVYLDGTFWKVREGSARRPVKAAGRHRNPFDARTEAARLFERQTQPWIVEGVALDETRISQHLHTDFKQPSLCGSRYHQRDSITEKVAIVGEIRAGREDFLDPARVCPQCAAMIDPVPRLGDRVTERTSQLEGIVIGTSVTKHIPRFIVQFAGGENKLLAAMELKLAFLENLPRWS